MESKSNLEALPNQRQLDEPRPVIYSSETFWEAVRICQVRILIKTVNHRFLFVQHLSAMKNVIKLFIATFQTGRQVSQHSLDCYETVEVFILFFFWCTQILVTSADTLFTRRHCKWHYKVLFNLNLVQTEIVWGSTLTCISYLKWLLIITKACMKQIL